MNQKCEIIFVALSNSSFLQYSDISSLYVFSIVITLPNIALSRDILKSDNYKKRHKEMITLQGVKEKSPMML